MHFNRRIAAITTIVLTATFVSSISAGSATDLAAPGPVIRAWSPSVTANSLTVDWEQPAAGPEVDDYLIEYGKSVSGPWTRFTDGTSSATTAIISGLATATAYVVRIAAVADNQVGPWALMSSTPPIVSIAAGFKHTCAALITGSVECWGSGEYGQLGQTNFATYSSPRKVDGITSAVEVAAGSFHTCALLRGGSVKCWGYNEHGQIGIERLSISEKSPQTVKGITSAISITAGSMHSCAVLANGTMKCWGKNFDGQIGNGAASTNVLTPVTVVGLAGAVSAAAGDSHTCAVMLDGTASCWGSNWSGELGIGTKGQEHTTPEEVLGIDNVNVLALGLGFTCAALDNGSVECWGNNEFGQLGMGTSGPPRPSPEVVSELSGVQTISSGYRSTCAARSTGIAVCWGANAFGQLGDGTTEPQLLPSDVRGLAEVRTIAVAGVDGGYGGAHACAVLATGGVSCWGSNSDGQLGDGTERLRTSPVAITSNSEHRVGTAGTRMSRIAVVTDSGDPVIGGAVTWVSDSGEFESAGSVGLTSAGIADLQRIPAGSIDVFIRSGHTREGARVSGRATVFIGSSSAVVVRVPDPPSASFRTIRVTLPGGLSVAGASVTVKNLSSTIEVGRFTYSVSGARVGLTDENGEFRVVGYDGEAEPIVDVDYNDGVLIQHKKSVTLADGLTTIELSEMPYLDLAIDDVQANLNALVPVTIVANDMASGGWQRTRSLKGVTVTIKAPAGASQNCKGATLTAKTDSKGKAKLAICATKSGVYTISGKGAVATTALTLRVKGAAPMPVTALSAVSPATGKLLVSWNPPVFTGGNGFPITAYTIVLTGGKNPVTVTLTKATDLAKHSYTFTGLASAKTYTATVTASNKAGASDVVRSTGGVA
jgi:alpha-tubulin suppressor-like RCC1 family protein